MSLWLKQRLVRTPLERPLKQLRDWASFPKKLRHPELREVHLEDGRIAQIMRKHITRDMNCLDIGCHIGSMLAEMLRLAPDGKHVAVEADPAKAAWLVTKFPEVDLKSLGTSFPGLSVGHEQKLGFLEIAVHKL